MYKLSGHSLSRGAAFQPESQGFTLTERDSGSSIQLGPEAPEIGFNDWILDDVWPEGAYVWRVKSLGDTANTETRNIELEHVIKTLDDRKLSEEVTTSAIAGSGATTVTARNAVQYLLSLQGDWVLGDFDYGNVSNPYEFGAGDSIFDALQTITGTLEDPVWEYDLSVYPFRLHIRRRNDEIACEMRAGRNLSTMRRSISRSGFYTRIYPIGKNNLRIDARYLSRNEGLYGRVDKVETDQSITTKEGLRAWAEGLLRRHSEPIMNITISGLELSAETGENLDRLKLNRICRCPLPKSNIMITERIVKLQWKDRRKEPENVTLSLCNSSADIAKIVKSSSRASGRAAAGQAKQNYLFQANGENLLYEVFDQCGHVHGILRMTEESLRIAFDNLNECTRSEFRMTSESLRIQFENEISSTRSEFRMTSESLRIQFENENTSMRSAISAEAGRITQIVQAVGADGSVTAASIVLAINRSTGDSEAKIDAGHVYIGNSKSTTVIAGKLNASDVTADYLSAKIASIPLLTINEAAILTAGVTTLRASNMYFTSQEGEHSVYTSVKDAVKTLQIVQSGNAYKLQKKSYSDADWVDVGTFNRAVALSGAWNGTTYNVSATSGAISGTAPSTTVYQTIEGAANPNTKVYAKIYKDNPNTAANQLSSTEMTLGESASGKYVELYTGSGNSKIQKGKISTAATYNAGWNYGQTQITRNTRAATDQETTVKTLDYSERYTIVDTYTKPDGTTSTIKYTVAAKADRYSDGQSAAGVTYNTSTHKVSRALSSGTKELLIDMYTGNAWSNGERVIEARIGNDAINSTTITAPSVTISCDCTDLGNTEEKNDQAIAITAKHGTATKGTKSQVIHMGTGSWSSGKIGVTCRLTDSNGKCLNRIYVNLPATASWTYSYISSSVGYQINCTIGGRTYTTTHKFS